MSIQFATQSQIEDTRSAAKRFVAQARMLTQGSQRQSRVPASRVAELDALLTVLKAALAAVVAASDGPTTLRSIAAESRVQDSVFVPGAARMMHGVRWPVTFGSADSKTFRQMDNGWYANSGSATTDLPNAFTIISASLEYNGVVQPVTWAGVGTRTITPGETEVISDALDASLFGVPVFTQNTSAWYEAIVSVPNSTASLPYCIQKNKSHRAGSQALYWDNSATTVVNGTNVVGALTFSGTAPVEVTGVGYSPFYIGTYAAGDPKVFVSIGDSISVGFGDLTSPSPVGVGYIQRMAYGDGSNIYSIMSISRSGSSAFGYLTTGGRLAALAKYGNRAIDNFGTNDFGISGTSRTRAQVLADCQANWASLRSYGITHIIRLWLLVESSGSWATEGAQTVDPDWDVGGPIDLFNTVDLAAELSAGRVNNVVPINAVRGTNPFKWKSPGYTADGTHPSTLGYTESYPVIRTAADAA